MNYFIQLAVKCPRLSSFAQVMLTCNPLQMKQRKTQSFNERTLSIVYRVDTLLTFFWLSTCTRWKVLVYRMDSVPPFIGTKPNIVDCQFKIVNPVSGTPYSFCLILCENEHLIPVDGTLVFLVFTHFAVH